MRKKKNLRSFVFKVIISYDCNRESEAVKQFREIAWMDLRTVSRDPDLSRRTGGCVTVFCPRYVARIGDVRRGKLPLHRFDAVKGIRPAMIRGESGIAELNSMMRPRRYETSEIMTVLPTSTYHSQVRFHRTDL